MRRPHGDAVAQHAARFRVGLGRRQLEFRAVEFAAGFRRLRPIADAARKRRPPPRRCPSERRGGSARPRRIRPVIIAFLPVELFSGLSARALIAADLSIAKITCESSESLVESRSRRERRRVAAACRRRRFWRSTISRRISSPPTGSIRAVDGVSYQRAEPARRLGVVGESGCGKSVTALSILRLVASPPGRIVGGAIRFEGRNLLDLSEARDGGDPRQRHLDDLPGADDLAQPAV